VPDPGDGWASGITLGLTSVTGKSLATYGEVKNATQRAKDKHQLTTSGDDWFWKRKVQLPDGPLKLDLFAQHCIDSLMAFRVDQRADLATLFA
jgi:hypothetical protein